MKILFLAANPQSNSRLKLDTELREIEEALKLSKQSNEFELIQKWDVRPRDFRRALLEYKPKGKYRKQTTEVGSFPPNAFGLYDMHGNVWEWCEDDWHNSYNDAPCDGKTWRWISTGLLSWFSDIFSEKVVRGSSWGGNPLYCRSARRGRYDAIFSSFYVGFRVVCSSA